MKICMTAMALYAFTVVSMAQADRKYIRKGNREYARGNFQESEILYRKAGEENAQSPEASFNIGDALYRQKKFEEAGRQFDEHTNKTLETGKKSAGFYNLGNSLLEANKIEESIEAYKNSLRLDPSNLMAKYNLGYAQDLLKQQEQQQQQKQNQEDQKDQDKKEDNKDNKDQQADNKQNQDQNSKEQQKEQEQGITREDAERLLNALANDEKEVQEKVKREKAAKARTRTLKNW